MTPRLPIKSGLLALAPGLFFGSAHADVNLLSDGDFESFAGMITQNNYATVDAGSPLGAWTVGPVSIDLVANNSWGAINGVSVDLSGAPGPGSISQTFMAQAGYTYVLAFDYYKNDPGNEMVVSFGATDTTYAVPTAVTPATLTRNATSTGLQTVTFAGGQSNLGPTSTTSCGLSPPCRSLPRWRCCWLAPA